MKSDVEKRLFKTVLLEDNAVRDMFSEKDIDKVLDPRNYLGTTVKQIELAVEKTKQERKARGLTG